MPTRSFDFVSMGFALRHVADLDALFAEMRRVLQPGGTACVLDHLSAGAGSPPCRCASS